VNVNEVAASLEGFVRAHFGVSPSDPGFDRVADLFDRGYVDSVGVVELLEFVHERFQVSIPDEMLFSDSFSNIDGIAAIVAQLQGGR
jgi:acyl carrier protein